LGNAGTTKRNQTEVEPPHARTKNRAHPTRKNRMGVSNMRKPCLTKQGINAIVHTSQHVVDARDLSQRTKIKNPIK